MIALATKWFTIACVLIWVGVSLNIDLISLILGKSYRVGLLIDNTCQIPRLPGSGASRQHHRSGIVCANDHVTYVSEVASRDGYLRARCQRKKEERKEKE